jgi:hypothetical protein
MFVSEKSWSLVNAQIFRRNTWYFCRAIYKLKWPGNLTKNSGNFPDK